MDSRSLYQSMIFMPNHEDKGRMLHSLTEVKRWFDEIPGKDDEVWRYFLQRELLNSMPIRCFSLILASAEKPTE